MFALAPPLKLLHRYQTDATLGRILRRLTNPRRALLSILAITCGGIWLGQVVLGILFRPAADPDRLRVWLECGLLAYAIWNLLKTFARTPIEPFEWTGAEQELLMTAPISRRQQILYRIVGIARSAALKATCFVVVMIPDLRLPLGGFAGMFLGLIFLDLIRIAAEVVAYGLSRSAFLRARTAIFFVVGGAALSALVQAACSPDPAVHNEVFGLLFAVGRALVRLLETPVGLAVAAPFKVFSRAILAGNFAELLLSVGVAAGLVAGLLWSVLRLDRWSYVARSLTQRRDFERLTPTARRTTTGVRGQTKGRIIVPRRWQGAGPLAWRQCIGAAHYRTTVVCSMIVPAVLSCLPLLGNPNTATTFLHLLGGLVFYSFVLLPTAFKFDFRRDFERIAVIKTLPISSRSVVVGQLMVPIVMCSMFQGLVLLGATLVRPFPLPWLVAALVSLIPLNLLIFAFENLVFVLFPYRLNQEGIDIFLRTILTFTAKGVLFTAGLAATLAWALLSHQIAQSVWPSARWFNLICFVCGLWLAICGLAASTFVCLVRAYDQLDPSQDLPANG